MSLTEKFNDMDIKSLFESGLAKEILYEDMITSSQINKALAKAKELSDTLTPEQRRDIIARVVRERMVFNGNKDIKIREVIKQYNGMW